MWRRVAALAAAAVSLLCVLPAVMSQQAYPQPRGDPSARPSGSRHALLQLLDESAPLSQPIRDWRPPDLRAWLQHESLASALGLEPLQRLQLPVYVNVFAVGFDGSGGGGVQLSQAMLLEWMQALEKVLPQSVLQHDALANSDVSTEELEHTSSSRRRSRTRGQEDGWDDAAGVDSPDGATAHGARISYRYHLRLVTLSPRVGRVVERYLAVHHRRANEQGSVLQVDGEILGGALEGLVTHLQLDDAYNVFVLNPNREWLPSSAASSQPLVYGYRSGLSEHEIDAIVEPTEAALKKFADDWRKNPASGYTRQLARDQEESPQPVPKFTSRDATETSASGEKRVPQLQVLDYLAASDEWASSVLNAPHQPGPQSLVSYLHQQAEHHAEVLRSTVSNPFAQEDCLVDAWVGRGRTLFLDLGAGPFSWGPIVGGEGLKSVTSFPSLRTFASARAAELSEESGEDTYADSSYDVDAVRAERMVLLDLLDAQCAGAGAALLVRDDAVAQAKMNATAACRALAEKLRVLDDFQARYEQRKTTAGKTNATSSVSPSPPLDSAAGLSFFHDDTADDAGSNGGHDASIEVDHFLAHLSSTLSASLEQVLTPSVGSTRVSGAYAERVHFHVYVLVSHQRYDPLADDLMSRLKFGLEQLRLPSQTFVYSVHKLTMDEDPALAMAYAGSMRSAVVPTLSAKGKFSAVKRLYIDSQLLQSALAGIDVQTKAEHDPLFGQENRAWDSSTSLSSARASLSSRTRDISLFLFSVDFPLPVLVDKFFQSQALPDANMVVAVQSNLHLWESPLSYNGQPVFVNLRDPVRSLLSSTARVLGGLLPQHVHYSRAHGRVSQQWQWSVGMSPLSLTSAHGLEFSRTQRDTLHRNYVLHAVRSATRLVNTQLSLLQRQRTSLANRMLAGIDDERMSDEEARAANVTDLTAGASLPLISPTGRFSARTLQLQRAYSVLADMLNGDITRAVEELDFDRACQAIDDMNERAKRVASLVRDLLAWNQRDACSQASASELPAAARRSTSSLAWSPHLGAHWYLLTACVCCAIGLWKLSRRGRTAKPHLN